MPRGLGANIFRAGSPRNRRFKSCQPHQRTSGEYLRDQCEGSKSFAALAKSGLFHSGNYPREGFRIRRPRHHRFKDTGNRVGAKSGWHHHGTRHLYGLQVVGPMRLEYVPRLADAVLVKQGDFLHIPPGHVHRDVNPDKNREFDIVQHACWQRRPGDQCRRPQSRVDPGR
jgi:hypothetical protein